MFNSYKENTLQYYPEKCINCLMCTKVCPHGVFTEGEKGKGHVELTRPEKCMECGACAGNCPVEAIEVESGVGCAWAMIGAALKGKDMDSDAVCCGEDGCCQ
ncbi:mercury methylation ferredoxin HgcB [Methanolobus sp. WCC4]|uniref:mercury methylation ferredoxin HgcB n=1 Tax=Methanolobus sp. WCC4 TaxID=3125784 RepID=UPI0030FB7CF6